MNVVRGMLEAEMQRCLEFIGLLPPGAEKDGYIARANYIERLLEVE